jgi:biotin carboxylase
MEVSLGGIFTTRKIPRDDPDAKELLELNRRLISSLGLVRGVTHTEFIKGREDGRFYFLETAARVGGANIAEAVEAATGLNLWAEWASVEIAGEDFKYQLPPHRDDYAGIIISLARQERPDTSSYTDSEIVFRLNKAHHAGLVVRSTDPERVRELIESYVPRFYNDFYATAPPLETANQ